MPDACENVCHSCYCWHSYSVHENTACHACYTNCRCISLTAMRSSGLTGAVLWSEWTI